MLEQKPNGNVRLLRDKAREAIALASECRWEQAVQVNRDILHSDPGDVDALNRLGKALSELGCYSQAREAFQRSLDRSPSNTIARKNLDRLAHLEDAPAQPRAEKLTPRLFIEESGKSCVTALWAPSPRENLARVTAGDAVLLKVDGATVRATTTGGEPLGKLEPRLAARLIRLLQAGNRYVAAVASVGEEGVAVILREVFRQPRLGGIVSFPGQAGGLLRSLTPVERAFEEDAELERTPPSSWSPEDDEEEDDGAPGGLWEGDLPEPEDDTGFEPGDVEGAEELEG